MQTIKTIPELRTAISRLRKKGKTIGFVPTMGALHEGHLSLVDIAKNNSDIVVASIFVNPAQFAPNEDFDNYPRSEQEDLKMLAEKSVDIAYLPTRAEMYPEHASLNISVGEIGKHLEGIARPHFFDGVALVVTKLFMQVTPDIAVFGEKDYQQLIVIKKLVNELNIPVEIIGAPICREQDGLAMSSRNIYLNEQQRQLAPRFYKTLCIIKEKLNGGEDLQQAISWGKEELIKCGFDAVDYIELCHKETLLPIKKYGSPARILAVVRLGGIRLLDNI